MKFATKLLAIVLLITISACDRTQQAQLHQQQILALGTLVDISIYGSDDQTAQTAIQKITNEMEHIHHKWHAWQPSPLIRINEQLAAGETIELDNDSRDLIAKGINLAEQSDQLFNPAAGKLIALWGFHSDERLDTAPPSQEEINLLTQQAPKMSDLTLNGNRLSSSNASAQLDVGGFAKGYAIDTVIAELRKLGIKNAIVNAGGDLRAIGDKGERPWRIGIRDPRTPGVIASLTTQTDESVFTSGDYERYFYYDGKRYHHIIDPRSGYPAEGFASVTVVNKDATTADAAATAILIAGPEKWIQIAKAMRLEEVMVIDDAGTVFMTAAIAKRIRFEVEPAPKTVITSLP